MVARLSSLFVELAFTCSYRSDYLNAVDFVTTAVL